MRRKMPYLAVLVSVPVMASASLAVSPSAFADCNYSGGSTLCASGDVRGGSSGAPQGRSAPYSPYPCYDYGDPLCLAYDDYDPGIIFDPPNVIIGGGRPVDPGYGVGRPGIGGGRPGGGIGRN